MPSPPTYPLNDVYLPSGGVILRSSDRAEFKVYKNILALASPFFRDMFSLPQQSTAEDERTLPTPVSALEIAPSTKETIGGLPVIDVSEKSETLNILLRIIYPVSPPSFKGISSSGQITDAAQLIACIEPVLEAALKYDMGIVVKDLCTRLLDAADYVRADGTVTDNTLAVRVYGLACRYRLKDEARAAAFAALRGEIRGVFFDGLREISAAQYFQLLEYHEKAVKAVLPLLNMDELKDPYQHLVKCGSCAFIRDARGTHHPAVTDGWKDYSKRAEATLRLSPRSAEIFSSKFMEEVYKVASDCNGNDTSCKRIHGNWQSLSQYLREQMEDAIAKVDIDLTEI